MQLCVLTKKSSQKHINLLTDLALFGLISAVAQIAQSVEQRIENPCVPGSIPGLGTNQVLKPLRLLRFGCTSTNLKI